MSKILILKNDRTGDLFVSLKIINKIINKYEKSPIEIFLSNVNYKFCFLFPSIRLKKILPMKLDFLDKIKILLYLYINDISDVYILSPKKFYYYLPFIFRKINFHAIVINSNHLRPSLYLRKYLKKFVIIDRVNLKKRKSSYNTQSELIKDNFSEYNKINDKVIDKNNFTLPENFVFFHYKKNLFKNLLNWNLDNIENFLFLLKNKYDNVLFSSEYKDIFLNNYYSKKFNTFNFNTKKNLNINDKNIFFLLDIDGAELFNVVKKSKIVIAPEGIISHMSYFLNKPLLTLMHFNIKNKLDLKNQLISCKEWFPPSNYDFIVLKKDFNKSINRILKRLI